MNFLISRLNNISLEIPQGDVQILIYNDEYEILNTFYTYRKILEKSPVCKSWFEKVDFYGDYIDLCNNMVLYNKSDEYSYSLVITGKNNLFDKYNALLIKDIIKFAISNKLCNTICKKKVNLFLTN
jgi:hypothetical protein